MLHEAGDIAVRVTSEGLIVVDDKYEENVAEAMKLIKSVSSQPIRYLLNTHHHTDHAGGDAVFIKTTPIVAHRNVRENFLRNKQPGAPGVTFTDQASVFVGGVEARAYYFGRAHTNGDAVIYFPDLKVIHTGDLITEGMPVMDYPNGASAVEWVKVLDAVLKLDFDTVIPGHGKLLTKERIRSDRDKLVQMNARMAALAKANVPVDQVFDRLKLADLGWDKTVSTVAFKGGLKGYYEEMKAAR
jgi:glyoxylase-like metal-dependent hydrolase (beta-lactamase superfamily II)